jgi:hypothetical protein
LIKFSTQILEDDIRHFAFNGEGAGTPYQREPTNIWAILQRVIEGRMSAKQLDAVIGEDREQKREFLEGVRKSRADTTNELEELRKLGAIPSFEQFFEDGAEKFVLDFIGSFDVAEECKRRGVDKLLRIPSIRAMVGLGMSFIYRTAVEGKTPRSSALRDLQHAPSAAAGADIFVTHDEELAFLFRRVPIKGFRVMRLHELLEDEGRRT